MERTEYVSYGEPAYPERLGKIQAYPQGLYVRGKLPDPEVPAVAIVGARMCSAYGRSKAREFGRVLAANGVQIISGLAKGIDGCAQEGALEAGGLTFAVMGCGVDICYPRENYRLYEQIIKEGGVISEYPNGEQPVNWHFPARNRIISGLADLVLVIEAKEKSGSLITADLALEQGKDVFALPGRVTDPLSMGCNRLIAQGAGIALRPEELLEGLGIIFGKSDGKSKKMKIPLEKKEVSVYACLDLVPKSVDEIMAVTALPIQEVFPILLSLQLKECIEEAAKGKFVRRDFPV
ncbi:DNA-processing protein DprA [Diplocloster modestus]|uniref:DNA-processing protein DprA n=1 Tax=Diplocloster modestus TaxID=2850322 RepID=A0ABS6KES5_9FIRM|nr:DNA-processing protein DprA [Diplocloster modestus]MBU9729035.1 DNA-processing protein DprA [Diplocloster modestus]